MSTNFTLSRVYDKKFQLTQFLKRTRLFVLDRSRSIADQIFIQDLIEFLDHFLWPIYWAALWMSRRAWKNIIESELRWAWCGHKIETAKNSVFGFLGSQ